MSRHCAGELARRFDVTPGCVLRIAHEAGVRRFWCCEDRFSYDELAYHRDNDCRGLSAWIEFEANEDILSAFEET